MLHPDTHLPVNVHDRESDPWPLVVAIAVIGPLFIAVAIAVLVALAD
jgi:hypothetical protein